MILNRYLMREIGTSFIAVASVLTVIFLAYSLTRFLSDAASGLFNTTEVWQLTFYKSVIALEVLLPIGFFFGLIVGFGRLAMHGEMAAFRAGGMRRTKIQLPLAILALMLATVVAVMSWHVRPWAYAAMYGVKDAAQSSSELNRIKAHRFYVYNDAERVVYVEGIDESGTELSGVFIRERNEDSLQTISSPGGTLEAYTTPTTHRLILSDATILRRADTDTDFLGQFKRLSLTLDAQQEIDSRYRRKAEPSTALVLSGEPHDRAEFHWRLSTPISVIVLTIAAFTMIDTRPRHSRYTRLPVALAIYAVYYNLLGLGRNWIEQSEIDTLWWIHGLMLSAILMWEFHRRRQLQ